MENLKLSLHGGGVLSGEHPALTRNEVADSSNTSVAPAWRSRWEVGDLPFPLLPFS